MQEGRHFWVTEKKLLKKNASFAHVESITAIFQIGKKRGSYRTWNQSVICKSRH